MVKELCGTQLQQCSGMKLQGQCSAGNCGRVRENKSNLLAQCREEIGTI